MKAITISQPWARLIASGEKFVENRSWSTNYRGPIAIHAGLGTQYLSKEELAEYPTSAVIAIARLAACVNLFDVTSKRVSTLGEIIPGTQYTYKQIVEHKYSEGPCCWILEDIQEVGPWKATGKQGLWVWQEQKELLKK